MPVNLLPLHTYIFDSFRSPIVRQVFQTMSRVCVTGLADLPASMLCLSSVPRAGSRITYIKFPCALHHAELGCCLSGQTTAAKCSQLVIDSQPVAISSQPGSPPWLHAGH